MDNWRIKQLLEMHNADKTDEFVIYAIAQEHLKSESFEESIKWFQSLKTQNPEYVGLYYHLGAAYAELEEYEDAMDTYNEGIKVAKSIGDQHALSELLNSKTNLELEL